MAIKITDKNWKEPWCWVFLQRSREVIINTDVVQTRFESGDRHRGRNNELRTLVWDICARIANRIRARTVIRFDKCEKKKGRYNEPWVP